MKPIQFFRPILETLNQGKIVRSVVAVALQVIAVLVLLGGLFAFVGLLKSSFALETAGTFGGVILSLLVLAAVVVVGLILLCRAADVHALGDSTYTVIPIFSILLRAFGECYATLGVALGTGGCIFTWLAGSSPLSLLGNLGGLFPAVSPEGSFLGGVLFLVSLVFVSFLVLVSSYFLAESTVVLVDIAANTRPLLKHGSGAS